MVSRVETAVERSSTVDDYQKQDIMALLQGKQEYSPQSGQITGMLKAMLDEMSGDLKTTNAVEIAQTEDDLEDTEAEVAETEKFLGDLASQCAAKKAEWSERQKMRAEEVAAISEAIGILNDDD